MIQIHRSEIPTAFQSKELESIKKIVLKFFERPHNERVQEKFSFPPFPSDIKLEVEKQFKNKCAYCESTLGSFSPSTVDNFRPQRGARGFGANEFYDDLYWWFAYDWDNLYLACPECSFQKASWFPIAGTRAFDSDDLNLEIPILLDPCKDKTNEHLIFNINGVVSGTTEKGKTTIEILKLNRESLVRARKQEIEKLENYIQLFLNNFREFGESYTSSQSFLSMFSSAGVDIVSLWDEHPAQNYVEQKRQFLFERIKNEPALKLLILSELKSNLHFSSLFSGNHLTESDWNKLMNYFGAKSAEDVNIIDSEPDSKFSKLDTIERIEIKNFRGIRHLDISFSENVKGQAPWLLFLGENGLGKSSILQALALILIGEEYRKDLGLIPADFIAENSPAPEINVHLAGGKLPMNLLITAEAFISNEIRFTPYFLAYGATRLMPQRKINSEIRSGNARVRNLFDPTVALHNASEWLYRLPLERFEYMVRGLRQILMLRNEDRISKSDIENKIIITHIGGNNTLEEMSEGYKTVVALAVDIMQILEKDNATLEEVRGVVIIDEIETHLHPRWKMRIVDSFRTVFPQVQFIVTTHDPLCLRGLQAGEVVILKRNPESNEVEIYDDLPSPEGFRVDQLLTSEYFGLHSTSDPRAEDIFNNYYFLLCKGDLTENESVELKKYEEQLKNLKYLGNTTREELMYHVIDNLLAKEYKQNFVTDRSLLKKDVLNGVKEAWNNINFTE